MLSRYLRDGVAGGRLELGQPSLRTSMSLMKDVTGLGAKVLSVELQY